MIVITPHLDRRTKDYGLDEAQQASTRALLNLRRQKYMSLIDSTPHPSIRLSQLAPMLDRITPAEVKQMESGKPAGKN
jgi:hypothetical protein